MTIKSDYQTPERMRQKLRAIPIPKDLTGLTVLDIGCDFGAFCKIASDRGAARVVGVDRGRGIKRVSNYVDIVEINNAQDWPNCEFIKADIAKEWPDFGAFDLVFCFSLYHHLYGATGDHDRIWKWLRQHTKGTLLWEGPVSTRDGVARNRAKPHGNYTRQAIWDAASRYFTVEHIGPAIHRPHREVWRCTARETDEDNGEGDERVREGGPGLQAAAHGGPVDPVSDEALSGDAEREGSGPSGGGQGVGGAGRTDGARKPDRTPSLVASGPKPAKRKLAPMPDRAGGEVGGGVSGDRSGDTPSRFRREGRPGGRVDESVALIVGGGDTAWSDIAAVEDMLGGPWMGLVIAANDVGCHLPTLDHWCTLHPEKFPKWQEQRRSFGHPDGYITWSKRTKLAMRQIAPWAGGASGLLAVAVAHELGVKRAILCGVPMTRSPHFAESTVHQKGRIWTSADGHWRAWKKAETLPRLQGWVRSMSGRTKDLLGAPDIDWLYGEQEAAA